MKVEATSLPDVLLIHPRVFEDSRGYLVESWQRDRYEQAGLPTDFVQDNESGSVRHTLRGLHYQLGTPQGKLVRVIEGEVFDVAVDLRRRSEHFGRWFGTTLSGQNRSQLWIPSGFAHGFLVLSEYAVVVYKCTALYAPADERTILWNDPELAIDWPLTPGTSPLVSARDGQGAPLSAAELFT